MITAPLREMIDKKFGTRALAATKLGVSQPYISDVLNGRRGLSVELAIKLAEFFGERRVEELLVQQTRSEFEKARQEAKRK